MKFRVAAPAVAIVLVGAWPVAWRLGVSPVSAPAKGPAGMVCVPGGKFLMGSDHKLAQDNERLARSGMHA